MLQKKKEKKRKSEEMIRRKKRGSRSDADLKDQANFHHQININWYRLLMQILQMTKDDYYFIILITKGRENFNSKFGTFCEQSQHFHYL